MLEAMFMATHLPINHWLRPFYRTLAAIAGGYCLAFGIAGVIRSHGHAFFAQSGIWALGLRTNMAFAILSIIVGSLVLGAALIGRNVDQRLNLIGGPIYLVVGVLMLALMDSDANFLNFGISTSIVSFVIGIVLLTAGLYGHVSTPDDARRHEEFRHSRRGDPTRHWTWGEDPTRTYTRTTPDR
jgi:hypothetical protein